MRAYRRARAAPAFLPDRFPHVHTGLEAFSAELGRRDEIRCMLEALNLPTDRR
jgi:hypothetical protein